MSMEFLFGLWMLQLLAIASATKLSDYEDGAEFDKCIRSWDWKTKTIYDDIHLVDRESGGCCPRNTIPGARYYENRQRMGPAVVCGFKSGGGFEFEIGRGSTGTMNTCAFNKCFVVKRNIECEGLKLGLMNGCCAVEQTCLPPLNGKCGFTQECQHQINSPFGAYGEVNIRSCYSGTMTHLTGTTSTSDDVQDGKLDYDSVYKWASCKAFTCTDVWANWKSGACDSVDAKDICKQQCGVDLGNAAKMCSNETTLVNGNVRFIREIANEKLKQCGGSESKCVTIPRSVAERIHALQCESAD